MVTNPFQANIRLAQASPLPSEPTTEAAPEVVTPKSKKSKVKGVESEPTELKVTDKVKIYTGVVPDLENGKDKLKEILEQDYDSKVRETLEGFVKQLENMQIAMLDFAKVAIQSQKSEAVDVLPQSTPTEKTQSTPPAEAVKITAAMINE